MRRWTLRTRLLVAFLLLSLLPGIGLTVVLTRTLPWALDQWASPAMRATIENAVDVARNTLTRIQDDLRQRWVTSQGVPELVQWRAVVREATSPGGAPPLANRFSHLGPLVGTQFNLDFMQVYADPPDSSWQPVAMLMRDSSDVAPGPLRPWRLGNKPVNDFDEGVFLRGPAGELAFARRARLADGTSQIVVVGIRLETKFYENLADLGTAVGRHDQMSGEAKLYKAEVYAGALLFTLLLGVASLLVAERLSRGLSRPVEELAAGLDRVATGEGPMHVEPAGSPEMRTLIESFNRMTVDLAESKAELARSARMAAWQDAARRIAHEIRNPLQPITLALHRIEKTVADDPERRERLREAVGSILTEVEALKRLAASFAEFARMPDPVPRPTDLGELVENALDLVRFPGVELHYSRPTAPVMAAVDRGQIRQVLTNLVKNAAEAMPAGGPVRLCVKRTDATPETPAVIEVADAGPGIPPEVRARLFQPYFTTKPEGSGLGLAIVRGIVTAHGGRVEVEPAESGGTLFRILLPGEPSLNPRVT